MVALVGFLGLTSGLVQHGVGLLLLVVLVLAGVVGGAAKGRGEAWWLKFVQVDACIVLL